MWDLQNDFSAEGFFLEMGCVHACWFVTMSRLACDSSVENVPSVVVSSMTHFGKVCEFVEVMWVKWDFDMEWELGFIYISADAELAS